VVSAFWPIAVLVVPEYAYHWPATPDFSAESTLQVFGFLLAVVGGLLFYTSQRALGKFMTPVIEVREDHRLIESGPYRYVRHPVYTAIVAVACGFSLFFLSPIVAVIAAALFGMAQYRARVEERMLGSPEAFGEAYRAYMGRTGRFLPRIRAVH
jgi:protein-S-isoprenylcysteine O-methyltransferase Ste14